MVMTDAVRVPVGMLTFDAITEDDVVAQVSAAVDGGVGGWICTPNIDILRRSARDTSVRELLGTADIVVADGAPVVWASRLSGRPLPCRVTGASLVWSLSVAAAAGGHGVYLLGGEPGVAERAASRLTAHAPGLQVTGTYSPAWGFETRPAEVEDIRERLVAAAPSFVFVGLGCPKQEHLIQTLSAALPGTWWIGCGAALDFAAGQVPRAPLWMQRRGLEWVYRMYSEPGRLVRRYLVDDAPYALRLMVDSALSRYAHS